MISVWPGATLPKSVNAVERVSLCLDFSGRHVQTCCVHRKVPPELQTANLVCETDVHQGHQTE